MKKVISVWLALALLLVCAGCNGEKSVKQDTSPITMFVGLGNGKAYFEELRQAIKDKLDIDVEFIYQAPIDTTSATKLEFKNNDLPADIVCTSSRTNAEWAANSCMDLMACTHLADYFTYQKLNEYMNEDGTVYQLPFTSKLIGITYNKTLMEENGWEVPENFADMLALKQECDEKGILFAVSANAATGHGFNYLFHLMGADWISTLDGSEWLDSFLNGEEDAARFEQKAEYFNQWVENGLFGSIHAQDWNSSAEYCGRRALFFFDLTNSITSFEGEMIDENGQPTGKLLNDEYATMPWISENGANNCYAYYDSMLMALNKKLSEPDQKEKLEKAVRILEFMTTQEATDIFTKLFRDGYVALNSFEIDESRLYYADKERIETGYLMPWYYSYFDEDTIVNTGGIINTYLRGEGESFETIIEALETNNTNHLQEKNNVLTKFEADLSYEETAKLNAIGAVLSLQNVYDEKGIDETVSAALVAYVKQLSDHQPFTAVGTLSNRVYAGEFEDYELESVISSKGKNVMGVRMTGSRLKEIAAAGIQDNEAVYPYVLVSGEEIKDDETYVVAVSSASLSEACLTEFTESGAILTDGTDTVTAPIKDGVRTFLQGKETMSARDLVLP